MEMPKNNENRNAWVRVVERPMLKRCAESPGKETKGFEVQVYMKLQTVRFWGAWDSWATLAYNQMAPAHRLQLCGGTENL